MSMSAADGCFAAAGFYQPEPEALTRLRARDRARAQGVERDDRQARQGGLALSDEYAMKRAPRGFEDVADPAIAAALRNKSFI